MRPWGASLVVLLSVGLAGEAWQAPQTQSTPPTPQTQQTPPIRRISPPQPAQRQGLEYFEGTWRFSWTGRESPISTGPRSGTVVFSRASDGASLEMRTEGTSEGAGAYTERGTVEWNEASKTLTVRERLATGVDLAGTGDWSAPISIRFESAPVRVRSQTLRVRRVYGIVSAHSFTVAEEMSVDGGAWVRLGGGVFSR